jgi:biopolymer transport protein ExbD
MRVPKRGGRGSIELQLTPMIDVVFLLLVFFLWTSSFDLPEFDLPSALAEPPAGLSDATSQSPPPEAFDELVITIRNLDSVVALALNGDDLADVSQLRERLSAIVDLGAQPPVIVDPDPTTDIGTVIEIYDLAREVGLDRVLFAADQ